MKTEHGAEAQSPMVGPEVRTKPAEPANQSQMEATTSVHIVVADVQAAADFYHNVFGAEIVLYVKRSNGKGPFARLRLGQVSLFISSILELDNGKTLPAPVGGANVILEVLVEDVDAALARALLAGATRFPTFAVGDHLGDQIFAITDPLGVVWLLSGFLDDSGMLCI